MSNETSLISTDFISKNLVYKDGEILVESDTGKRKIGNGISRYNDLKYLGVGGDVINVTYAEFVSLITNGKLIPSCNYVITDFQTTHYMCNGDGVINDPVTSEPVINTGAVERLVVHAISNNELAPISHSLDFPEDEICWDWNPANWVQDIGFSTDQENIIPNFKGVIFRRFDTVRENLVGYDFRTVKFRRWKNNYSIWSTETTYNLNDRVQVLGDGCYVSLIANNLNNTVSDTTKWVKVIDYTKSEYWEHDDSQALDITDFQDYLTFVEFGVPYERAVKNVKFSPFRDTQDQFWGYIGGILSNNVFFLSSDDNYSVTNNSFDAFCELNTFNDYFNNNSIGANFASNSIGTSFYNNSIGANFTSNSIGVNFTSNSIGVNFSNNSIGANFTSNSIGTSFYNNSIGANFYNNSIGAFFNRNSIGSDFNQFIISNNFTKNNAKDGLSGVGIDFSASTHIYADYNCELLKTSTGTYKLKYVDGSDNTEKIVDINV